MDNPAGRLLAAFRKAEKQQKDATAQKGWCTVWDLAVDTIEGRAECSRRGSEMILLGIETQRQSKQISPTLTRQNLESFTQVQAALDLFTKLPTIKMGAQLDQIKPDGWLALGNLDGILSEYKPEPVIIEAERDSLLDQTRELVDAVRADNTLSPEAKRQIIEQLRAVEQALLDAELTGSVVIERAANGLAGVMFKLHTRGEKAAKHPITNATIALMLSIGWALNVAADYHELTTDPVMLELVDPSKLPLPPPAEPPELPAPDAVTDPDE